MLIPITSTLTLIGHGHIMIKLLLIYRVVESIFSDVSGVTIFAP